MLYVLIWFSVYFIYASLKCKFNQSNYYFSGTLSARLCETHGAIMNSAEVYQQILGPGHTVCRWQTQSNGDEAQHWLPDPSSPVFGLCWHILVLVLLRGQSLDKSVAGWRPAMGWGEAHYSCLEIWSRWELLKVRRGVYCCHVESVSSPLWLVEESSPS